MPGIKPFKGCRESNNLSYFSLSEGLIVQSTAEGGSDVIKGVEIGGGGFVLGKGISPCKKTIIIIIKILQIIAGNTI